MENYFGNANGTDQRRQTVVLNYVDYAGRDGDLQYLRTIANYIYI